MGEQRACGDGRPRPVVPRLEARVSYALHPVLAANSLYRRLGAWLERRRLAYRWFARVERVAKERLYGCRMCGQCALPDTGYTCPMTCPKQLRNGPCGGVAADGRCEVHPELACVWVIAFERAQGAGHGSDLDLLQRPVDHREWDRSSWVNYWQGRDDGLGTAPSKDEPRPLLRRELGLRPR
ncbi:methylenetetrahydrofolate reductase C-terminal domain-containing protein [Nonomuraea sp. NPDC048882]|uniref:methylenetetrahydrofolate reductase C-terminal domain-containing protein n=1 Tax=Nonomuraea sp. NPDC048882 TaxID=3154347 RepID=UPI0033C9DF5A